MLSIVEIIYFFTVRAWFYFKNGEQEDDKDNSYCAPSSTTKGTSPEKMLVRQRDQVEMNGFPPVYNRDNSLFFTHYR